MSSPIETKELVQKINKELGPLTDKFQERVPIFDIAAILTANSLNATPLKNAFQPKDEGRLHVEIGEGIYFTMTWYRFESGRYEPVAYASSQHDDAKVPAKQMDASSKRKATSTVNVKLQAVGAKYWGAISAAAKEVADELERVGFDAQEFDNKLLYGIAGKKQGNIHAPIGNNMYISFSWYKMEVTGNYEIVTYVS